MKDLLISPLLESPAELIDGGASNCSVVISTRVRLARNLEGYPFPGWAKAEQRTEVLNSCRKAVKKLPQMKGGTQLSIDDLSDLEKHILMERHLISRELMVAKPGAGICVSKAQDCSIMINEEDHLRIQYVSAGFNFKRVWKAANTIDSVLENHLNYAFSTELGYLTACPTNVGTGMRASAMMHLPALVIASQMEKVIRAVNQAGIAVRGLFGEGSDASGSIFQISNQQTLGMSETDIIKNLSKFLNVIIEHENNARQKLLEDEPEKVFDKVGRAYGILKNAHLLTSAEAMNLLSLLRLAIDLNILPATLRANMNRLFIESQPGHIQHAAKEEIEPGARDLWRARYFREQFVELPHLNFKDLQQAT